MITLILFHLCGVGRIVKRVAWSLLVVWCVYTSSIALFGSQAHAQTQDTSVLYESLSALQVLEYHDQYSSLFKGNNGLVFELLKETYRTWDNLNSFNRFITAFDSISSDQRRRYDIEKNEVIIVLKAIELVAQRSLPTRQGTQNSNSEIPYGYTTTIYPKEEWMLVVFETNATQLPSRMNRYFWDRTQYSCEREQCRRFNHMYKTQEEFTIDVYSSMSMHNSEKKSFRISIQ
jgi:hypothetical protein